MAKDCQEKYREAHREELRIKARQYYYEHREQQNTRSKDYSKKNKDKVSKLARAYYHKHREEVGGKRNAQKMARRIPLKEKCEICGATGKLERHHPDYNKPLEVITVCSACNKKLDYVPRMKLKRVCQNPDCGKEFTSVYCDTMFCSKKCEWKVWSEKHPRKQAISSETNRLSPAAASPRHEPKKQA